MKNKKVIKDTSFLKSCAFSKEIKKTKLYKEAGTFFDKEFVDNENIVEPIFDVCVDNASYNFLKLKIIR